RAQHAASLAEQGLRRQALGVRQRGVDSGWGLGPALIWGRGVMGEKREKRWVFAPADRTASARLAHSLQVSDLTATLLVNRGVREPADARGFLKPELSALINPDKFNDMPRAVDRLEAAVNAREKIAIFGDYDVDGTSG